MHLHLKPPTEVFSYYPHLREAISIGTSDLCRKWPTSWLIVWDLNVFFPCTVSSLVTRALHPFRKRSVWRDLGWKSSRVGAEEFISSRWWRGVLELCRSRGVVCKRSLRSGRHSLKLVNADLYVIVPRVENSQYSRWAEPALRAHERAGECLSALSGYEAAVTHVSYTCQTQPSSWGFLLAVVFGLKEQLTAKHEVFTVFDFQILSFMEFFVFWFCVYVDFM